MTEILVIMNNYFHDVATAFLASSALLMLAVARLLPEKRDSRLVEYFLAVYRKFTFIAKAALLWILVGGILSAYIDGFRIQIKPGLLCGENSCDISLGQPACGVFSCGISEIYFYC
ncbi:MAG: hypothetical protein M1609_04955 [Firmicutes bacterium]|nr:hypothetical protein [Bacillota bacterium]